MRPRVLILRTAGTNCDKETEFAFKAVGAKTFLYHLNYVQEKDNLTDYQIIAIPGGFSYGDDLGAGKIFSLKLTLRFKDQLQRFIEEGGLIIGICNGFQVLAKTGILPDADFVQKVTLTFNDSGRFEDRWMYLKIQRTEDRGERTDQRPEDIWLKGLPQIINLPVAHGEGKFYAEKKILDTIERYGQVVLRYVDSKGRLAGYPFNPNGSLHNIAGIIDRTGRILGLMPHPERFIFKHHWPYWRDKEQFPFGLKIFQNAVDYFR